MSLAVVTFDEAREAGCVFEESKERPCLSLPHVAIEERCAVCGEPCLGAEMMLEGECEGVVMVTDIGADLFVHHCSVHGVV